MGLHYWTIRLGIMTEMDLHFVCCNIPCVIIVNSENGLFFL